MATKSFGPIEATPREPVAAPGTKPSIHHVYEDQMRPGKWTTRLPERMGPPVEDAESAQHALVVRYKLSDKPDRELDLHSIVVQSPFLKDILSGVFEEYPGITIELDRLEFNAPFECFVHRWEKLKAVREEFLQNSVADAKDVDQPAAHLELLFKTMEEEFAPILREKQDLLKHGVMKYNKIWTIFEPGSLIYHKVDDHDRVYKLKSTKYDTSNGGGKVYKLEVQFVDFDGTQFGMNKDTLYINGFPGTKKISKFEAYPLSFHENAEELKKSLVERGRKFEAYKGYHFVGYDGIAFGRAHRGETKYNVNSRVIIDAHAYARYNSKVSLEYFETKVETEESSHSKGNDEDSDEDVVVLDKDVGKKTVPVMGKKPEIDLTAESVLTDEQLLLSIPSIRGYSLRDKKWFSFYIDGVKDIVWNEFAFESLVAPPEQKDLILAFAESQIKNREHFDDFIQGKGKGIIMLLSGPPGVGKTLTAESVAEAMKAPLYSIGAADLGSKPNQLEKSLHDILEMCAKWNAGKVFSFYLEKVHANLT